MNLDVVDVFAFHIKLYVIMTGAGRIVPARDCAILAGKYLGSYSKLYEKFLGQKPKNIHKPAPKVYVNFIQI